MPIPCCIDDYNHHVGGVDIADQLRSYYDTQLTSFRTWWPMYFWALDTIITNAYFIYLDMPQASKTIAHKEFRLQCAWGRILAGTRPIATPHPSRSTGTKTAGPYVRKDTELPPDQSCDCGHHPVHLEGRRRLACWLCRYQERKPPDRNTKANKTSWACSKCDRPLCLNDNQNCFVEFHKL